MSIAVQVKTEREKELPERVDFPFPFKVPLLPRSLPPLALLLLAARTNGRENSCSVISSPIDN